MITLSDVSKIYSLDKERQVIAVENINLQIEREEFTCIIGASGCGKSTLLYLISGLIPPTTGEIKVDGEVIRGPTAKCGMVFQADSVFPWLTVERNVRFGPELRDLSKDLCQSIARRYINLVGLQGFEDLYPKELSGGMKKRVDVARAFANDPAILLMDEPFGALDALTKEHLQQELLKIWDEERKTVLFVTHDLEEAIFLASKVIVMSRAPNTVQKIIEIPFERPREAILKTTPEFQGYRRQLWALLETDK